MSKASNIAKDTVLVVGGLLCIIMLLLNKCSDANSKNAELSNQVSRKNDTIRQAYKKADSIRREAIVLADVAEVTAKNNEALKDTVNQLQQLKEVQSKGFPSTDKDTDDWKEKYLTLINENVLLKQQLSQAAQKKETPEKQENDTVRTKPRQSSSFDAPYSIFRKGDEQQLPRLQINAAFQVSHSWLNMTNSLGIGGNIYWKHLRIYNGVNYNLELKKIGGTTSIGYDIFNIYKSKK